MQLKPGRDADRTVHENFFKQSAYQVRKSHTLYLPFYTTDMSDAWKIIESMRGRDQNAQKTFLHNLRVCVYKKLNLRFEEIQVNLFLWATPVDICIAALQTEGKL